MQKLLKNNFVFVWFFTIWGFRDWSMSNQIRCEGAL